MVQQAITQDRIRAAIGVAAFHALLGYALVTGLGYHVVSATSERLTLFDVAPEPPPPPPLVPAKVESKAPEGAASPANLQAAPAPVVAPPPIVQLEAPPPIVAAPVASTGNDSSAGASDRPGPGTGAGGEGTGLGSGGEGDGIGSGGVVTAAQWVSGRIRNSDYPREAWNARAGGEVIARLEVGADGRVKQCTVIQSSGHADLDATTCRLIKQRFRYRPARDARGNAVPDVKGWKQTWWLER